MKLNFNNINLLTSKKYIIIFSILFIAQSCSKDDPEEIHEHEEINRVSLTFSEGSNSQTVTWDEGSTIPTINIDANKTYQVGFYVYNASNPNDVENITTEIIEEADEHFVFYELAGVSNLSIQSATNDVSDSDGIAININTTWTTGDAESGTVRVYLIHGPSSKSGTTRAQFGGGTDVEVNFPISIQ